MPDNFDEIVSCYADIVASCDPVEQTLLLESYRKQEKEGKLPKTFVEALMKELNRDFTNSFNTKELKEPKTNFKNDFDIYDKNDFSVKKSKKKPSKTKQTEQTEQIEQEFDLDYEAEYLAKNYKVDDVSYMVDKEHFDRYYK